MCVSTCDLLNHTVDSSPKLEDVTILLQILEFGLVDHNCVAFRDSTVY